MQTNVEEIITIREATENDIEELISLIKRIFDEYGMEFILEDELPDFMDFTTHYDDQHSLFVAEHNDTELLAGCTALKIEHNIPRLSRVYVRKKDRGKGIGNMLVKKAEEKAAKQRADWIHLWTDTRFERAHMFYDNLGYDYTGRVRPLNDVNESYEYHFAKQLNTSQKT